jgi:hypothetical protein
MDDWQQSKPACVGGQTRRASAAASHGTRYELHIEPSFPAVVAGFARLQFRAFASGER